MSDNVKGMRNPLLIKSMMIIIITGYACKTVLVNRKQSLQKSLNYLF